MRNVGMRELEKVQEGGDRTYIKGAVAIRKCVSRRLVRKVPCGGAER